MLDQLSRLKQELAPCSGFLPGSLSQFGRPVIPVPHSTPLPNLPLPPTYPLLPVIIRTVSLSPSSWLESEKPKMDHSNHIESHKGETDVVVEDILTNSANTSVESGVTGFRSACPGFSNSGRFLIDRIWSSYKYRFSKCAYSYCTTLLWYVGLYPRLWCRGEYLFISKILQVPNPAVTPQKRLQDQQQPPKEPQPQGKLMWTSYKVGLWSVVRPRGHPIPKIRRLRHFIL